MPVPVALIVGVIVGVVITALAVVGMMSKMFAGEVAAGMGEVAAADEKFLQEILGR